MDATFKGALDHIAQCHHIVASDKLDDTFGILANKQSKQIFGFGRGNTQPKDIPDLDHADNVTGKKINLGSEMMSVSFAQDPAPGPIGITQATVL